MIALLLLWFGTAQKPAEQATLQTTTRLVHVNVAVRDAEGHAVAGLSQDDFEVTDNGVPQQIRFFSVENAGARPAAPPREMDGFTGNARARSVGAAGGITIILLDPLNTARADQVYAQQQVAKYIAEIRAGEQVALYSLANRLEVLQPPTSDPAALQKAVVRYRMPIVQSQYTREDTVLRTMRALESIAHHLSGMPGRKNLVWVSSAFPLVSGAGGDGGEAAGPLSGAQFSTMGSYAQEVRRASRVLSDSDVAVFPVDARGLMSTAPQLADPRIATMQEIARRTGGRAFFERNDLDTGIRQVIDASRVSYSIGFYPAAVRGDGKFHELRVRVRRPGAAVFSRRGYYDWAEPPQDEESRKDAVRAVVASPLDASGIGLSARLSPGKKKGTRQAEVRIDASGIGLTFARQGGLSTARLDVVLVPMDNKGEPYPATFDPFHISLNSKDYERVRRDGLWFRREFDVHRKATVVRMVVRDCATGVVGSLTLPLD